MQHLQKTGGGGRILQAKSFAPFAFANPLFFLFMHLQIANFTTPFF